MRIQIGIIYVHKRTRVPFIIYILGVDPPYGRKVVDFLKKVTDDLIEDVISTKFEMRKWKLITETSCGLFCFMLVLITVAYLIS
ncbi:hypothetical protein YC2023_005652 [Brassica napus]